MRRAADIVTVDRLRVVRRLLIAWALIHAGRDGVWETLGEFTGPLTCEQVRDSNVANEATREIGSALADQPADNPMRQQAFERAARRVRDRYRCEWHGG